ncbi:MAG TPA: ATP-binding protein [Anaerolineae bacterium]|nr:ATP-binding protein [Anaerolineae bacterium]
MLSLVFSVALPLMILVVINAVAEILAVADKPSDVATAKITDVITRNVLLSIAVVIVALLMARLIMRRIEPPLQALIGAARAVSAGNDAVVVEPVPDRDLADLALAFNQMVASLREATAQLEQAAARYRELFENSRDALFVIDLDGRTVDANAAAVRLTGYTLDDMQVIKPLDLVPMDMRESRAQRLRRYQEAQGLREMILITRDGARTPVEVAVTPIIYRGQVALLGAARDISERRRAEEGLVRLSQRILTLNEAGLRMQETFDAKAILDIVGDELRRQRFDCLLADLADPAPPLPPPVLTGGAGGGASTGVPSAAPSPSQGSGSGLRLQGSASGSDAHTAQVRYVSNPDWEAAFRSTIGMRLIGYTFSISGPVERRAIQQQQTVMIEDAHKILESGIPRKRRADALDMFTRLRLTRAVFAPLVVDRQVKAVLLVTGHDLQEVDTPAIAAFARQVAVTLENAQLYAEATQKTEEVEALNEIADIVSRSLDLPAVLEATLTTLRRVVDYDSAAIYLDDGRQLTVAAARGYPGDVIAAPHTLPRDDRHYVRLAETREPSIVPDPAESVISNQLSVISGVSAAAPGGVQSWMGVPLLAQDNLIGFISIDKQQAGAFDAAHARRAQAFAQIAATAIEKARLFDRERRALGELSALAGITEAGLSVLRLDDMLHELIRRVVASTGAAAGMILLLEGDRLVARAAVGLDPEVVGHVETVGHGFAGRIAATGRSLIVADAQVDSLVDNPFIREAGIQTMLGVPLKATVPGDASGAPRVLGVAHIDFKSVRTLEATEIARFEVMADRAARAIENAQLVERISAHAEELERRVAERTRELEQALVRVREADRMKSQLLSTVSHELRTPLASIKGYVTTLIDYRDRLRDATQEEFLHIVDEESDRLRELVENLLDMSRIEAGVLRIHPELTRLTPVVERALAALQPKLAGREVSIDSLDDLPDVMIDSTRIQQVLSNLLDNAAKYSPPGTPIHISVSSDATRVTVGVHDRGAGIPPEHAGKIFDRFYRIENAGIRSAGGIGLGLAISRGLIEAHGGRMWVDSLAGRGSTFYFSIPVVRERDVPTKVLAEGVALRSDTP